ncbi:hypothetical protein ACFFUO_03830 [Vibrio artabrorum]|uniref:hypothetical protein n=1 Tax=Vibrio artabrorum TaxID=446374 RepID=UPI0021C26A20|nr:hypothetical protein [Vibrio artabrorum]
MNKKVMLSFCVSTLLLTGCQEGGGKSAPPSTGTKSGSQDINVTASLMNRVDVELANIQSVPKPDIFQFSNIQLVQDGLNVIITNPTPQKVKRFVATLGDNKTASIIELDNDLPAYSKGLLSSSTATLNKLKLIDQLHFFKPKVQMVGFKENGQLIDCNIVIPGKSCYGPPNEHERFLYEVILTNMHNAFNRYSFINTFKTYFADPGECGKYDCKNYKDTKLSYAERNFLVYGIKDHALGMRVMRNKYSGAGMGGGGMPNLNESFSTAGGWGSVWQGSLDPNSPTYRGLTNANYNTVWHEGAHAYGFSHSSGMTYGFQAAWSFDSIFGDSWGGSGNSFMDTKVTTQERENRSEIKLPSVIIKHDNISKYKVNLSFSYPYSESKPTTIMLNYLTSKEVNLKTNYKPGSDTVTLTFDKPLEAPVYIRAMAKGKDYMSTIVLDNKDIIPSTSYIVDGKKYSVLADELLDKTANGWDIRKTCTTQGGVLATKAEYQKLWDYLSDHNQLSELVKTQYLTKDEPASYQIWQVDFQPNEMDSRYISMKNPLGNENGLVCISDLD